MNRFILPYHAEVIYDEQILKTWGVKYVKQSMGEFVSILCFNNSMGCDGKVIDFLIEGAPADIKTLISDAQKTIASWKTKTSKKKEGE